MSKKFTRTIEDFVCEHCGTAVVGNGYTNHCPKCLWSKHVDISPGDREETCGGLMEPIQIEKEGKDFKLTHKCVKCGFARRDHLRDEDNFEAFLALSRKFGQ